MNENFFTKIQILRPKVKQNKTEQKNKNPKELKAQKTMIIDGYLATFLGV